jgi:hypothetical protein
MITMGLFNWQPKVPDTISDAEMAALSRRAQKANTESMFSKRNVEKRLKSNEQQEKRELS